MWNGEDDRRERSSLGGLGSYFDDFGGCTDYKGSNAAHDAGKVHVGVGCGWRIVVKDHEGAVVRHIEDCVECSICEDWCCGACSCQYRLFRVLQ
jgi:hypothetical protein